MIFFSQLSSDCFESYTFFWLLKNTLEAHTSFYTICFHILAAESFSNFYFLLVIKIMISMVKAIQEACALFLSS